MMKPEPVTLFLSYAHKDESLCNQLKAHLSLLQHQGLVSIWYNRPIIAGTDWAQEIDTYLEQAAIILLLVSPDFLASDYCYGIEMKRALERHEAGQARVIPIALRPCDWKDAPFAHLQAVPTHNKAITTWNNRDKAWTDVTNGIIQVIDMLSNTIRDRKLLDDLGADFQVRQQAISRVAKADPGNIQEVAASQLSIINSYYQSGLQQSQRSFQWSLIWGGIGLAFLIAAVSFLLLHQPTNVAFASSIGGAIVEVFAATYLYLYKHASDQLAIFRASLEGTQRLLLANSMCEKLEGEIEQHTRAELIQSMVNSVVSNPLPMLHEKKKQ